MAGAGGPVSVMVSYRCSGGLSLETWDWRTVELDALGSTLPLRTFRWYKGQKHYSGTFWSATEHDHVIYESRLELARLLFADFDSSVHHIVALHTVTVLNSRTYEIRSVIDVGLFPEDIAFAHGGRQAFVINSTDGTVSVINTATRTVTQAIDLAPIPMTFPFGVIATRTSKKVYVTSVGLASDAGIAILDNSDPRRVTIGGTITLPGFTHRPALTPDGRLLIVPRVQIGGGPEAVLIDTATDRVVDVVSLDSAGGPQAATVTPDGRFAYVGIFGGVLGGDGEVAVVDLARRTTVMVIRTPAPEVHGVRASPNGKFVIATNYGLGTVSVIATATNPIVANIPVGAEPNDVAFTTNGRRAFVTNQEDTTVSVLSLPGR